MLGKQKANLDFETQLDELRQRIARIDRKWAARPSARARPGGLRPSELRPARYFIENLMSGQIVATRSGEHFQTEKLYERHRRYGSVEISSLADLPADLLGPLSGGTAPHAPPSRWAFLDTETTGLAGGAGTYAFLIGVGSIDEHGFRVRQFFMRDFGDEVSLLEGLSAHLAQFDVLITYNGKTYDLPLLENRYRMTRLVPPFERLAHLDLLFGARRLWKLRLDSCRLVDLENQILGVEREGDLPGEMIPYYYFDYLRTSQAFKLVPIFHHNVMDIVSLAALTSIVPFAYRSPEDPGLGHGADYLGVARWLIQAGRHDRALALLRRAVDAGLPDALLFRTLWDIAGLERKLDRAGAALSVLGDLAASRNPYRVPALAELAKHYEHRERDYTRALEFTATALTLDDSPELRRRHARLRLRLDRAASPR
ncbi:MAG: ribonuclease H-like domain-containing protein, partial [Bryobacteraceae bacterium]